MDLTSRLVYTLVVIFTIFCFGLGSGLVLTTHPKNFDSMTHQLNISCQVHVTSTKSVAYIEVKKERTGKLFYINYLEVLTKGPGFRYNMKADGYIGTNDGNTFLNVVINEPIPSDAGMYKCQVYFYDERYNWSEETVVSNVTFVERDIADKVSSLMTISKKQNNDITTNEQQLEMLIDIIKEQNETIHTQEMRLDNMTKKLDSDVTDKVSSLSTTVTEQNKLINKLNNEITQKQQQLNMLIDFNLKQNKTIYALGIRLDNMTKKLDRDVTDKIYSLVTRDRRQSRKIKKSNNKITIKQHLNLLIDFSIKQNKTIQALEIRLENITKNQERDFTDKVSSLMTTVREQNNDIAKNQQQLARLNDFIKKQNKTCHTDKAQPESRAKKQALLQTGWKYYTADKTFIKAFGNDDRSKYLTWSKARKSCRTFGADLVQIHDEDKSNFVSDLFDGASYKYPWIGIKNTARHGFAFKYVDGSDLGSYHPWYPGHPYGDTDDDIKCVPMSTDTSDHPGKWYDASCSGSRPYVCSVSSLNIV